MKARIAIAAFAVAATSLPMAAGAALPRVYDRPLDACTTAIENQFDRGEVTDTFHSRMDDGTHRIYANVETRQLDGSTEFRRVTCETNRSGRSVVELSAADGRWVDREQG
ncbi:MAG: hypothetical protein V2J24_17480 [Pseudomonadales bacterium]|jgi:hypothetical protein|nr:hypothetical protein [Pseudomonadales bacterium]